MNARTYVAAILLCIITGCQQRTTSVSDPIGWKVISRELIYNRSDGALIIDYIDSEEWVLRTETSSYVRTLRQTSKTYTARVEWIDAQGKRRADPELNLWNASTPQQFLNRQKRALIGKTITPSLVERILKPLTLNAKTSYRGVYCGQSVLVIDHGDIKSHYDVKTGTLLAQFRHGIPYLTLQTGKWELQQGKKRGIYHIVCR